MEFLFHGGSSQDDVLWLSWGGENPECVEADFREGNAATVQWPGGN